jgi:hypothetical protein
MSGDDLAGFMLVESVDPAAGPTTGALLPPRDRKPGDPGARIEWSELPQDRDQDWYLRRGMVLAPAPVAKTRPKVERLWVVPDTSLPGEGNAVIVCMSASGEATRVAGDVMSTLTWQTPWALPPAYLRTDTCFTGGDVDKVSRLHADPMCVALPAGAGGGTFGPSEVVIRCYVYDRNLHPMSVRPTAGDGGCPVPVCGVCLVDVDQTGAMVPYRGRGVDPAGIWTPERIAADHALVAGVVDRMGAKRVRESVPTPP